MGLRRGIRVRKAWSDWYVVKAWGGIGRSAARRLCGNVEAEAADRLVCLTI